MTVRRVRTYPDPALKRRADEVGAVTEQHRRLADDLVATMRAGPATVGLAAPQIGVSLRACCLDVSGDPRARRSHGLLVLFDPVLVETEGRSVLREGCLSVPHLTANVRRGLRIVVEGADPDGERQVLQMDGFEARALQHEMDHLDGLLILDRVDSAGDLFPRKVYK